MLHQLSTRSFGRLLAFCRVCVKQIYSFFHGTHSILRKKRISYPLVDVQHLKISSNPFVQDYVLQLKDIQAKISDHLLHAQAFYQKVLDHHCLDSSANEAKFRVGDHVQLLWHNVKSIRPHDKLDYIKDSVPLWSLVKLMILLFFFSISHSIGISIKCSMSHCWNLMFLLRY